MYLMELDNVDDLKNSSFATRLKYIRSFRNIKQIDIVRALNITPALYSSWEKGSHLPRSYNFSRLAQFLNVPVELLVKGPKDGVSLEQCLSKDNSMCLLPLVNPKDLNLEADLPSVLAKAPKDNFNLLSGLQSYYSSGKIFLFNVADDSMARLSGRSLNPGMQAVIVNEPNVQTYLNKPVLLATDDSEGAIIREVSIEQPYIILKSWNKDYDEQKLDLTKRKVNIFGYVAMVFCKFYDETTEPDELASDVLLYKEDN